MDKWTSSTVIDALLNYIKTNCNKIALIKGYTDGDSYATVTAAILAEATATSTDFTIADGASTGSRKITNAAGLSDTSANASSTAYVNSTATSGGASTLTDSTKSWTTNEHAGRACAIVSGTGSGQCELIASNTATELTVDTAWSVQPDATSVYRIGDALFFAFLNTTGSEVLWVTPEITAQAINSGNEVTFPQLTLTVDQPI
jgi:predicted regulator of Ras-like GTPase activity (Roadblock/LC7/MglB family)